MISSHIILGVNVLSAMVAMKLRHTCKFLALIVAVLTSFGNGPFSGISESATYLANPSPVTNLFNHIEPELPLPGALDEITYDDFSTYSDSIGFSDPSPPPGPKAFYRAPTLSR